MSKHRLEPPTRVRPRVGRIAAAGVSLVVTVVALLGAVGVIPLGGPGSAASQPNQKLAAFGKALSSAPAADPHTTPSATPSTTPSTTSSTSAKRLASSTKSATTSALTALPADSGSGRRVVFSIADQRVWLVNAKGASFSTYLVSGSLTDNLQPGKYAVFSRSRWAVGIDDSGVMQYFVRFAHGKNAAIGFHTIPTQNGKPEQTVAQLGTPSSHGCIRQKTSDAIRMWGFAQDGTDVVVVA
ncbi:MAG TPA: L,D-transpeptidase [Marmoricola sp.]|jgi:lipoprotein-anchoring transpeptidase ErfK/SrfK|nr:L,D-transpeptidase [Marmoricola sp.]